MNPSRGGDSVEGRQILHLSEVEVGVVVMVREQVLEVEKVSLVAGDWDGACFWDRGERKVEMSMLYNSRFVSAVYSECILECALKIDILMHIFKIRNVHFENGWCYFLGAWGAKHRPVTPVAEKGV